jgi:hypothetical protein
MECFAAPPSDNAPVVLLCGHSVCKQCAEALQAAALRCRKGGGPLRIACPSCRKLTVVPAGGAKSLPVNFGMVQATQLLEDAVRGGSGHKRAAAKAAPKAKAKAAVAAKADGAFGGGLGIADLLQQLKFTSAQIAEYLPALTEAGYDLVEDLAAVAIEELMEDAGMKKPHARRITSHFG